MIPGLEGSLGGGNGNPLQYLCLGNLTDRGAWWAIQSMGSQRVGHFWMHTGEAADSRMLEAGISGPVSPGPSSPGGGASTVSV